jgi:hypothetical protein
MTNKVKKNLESNQVEEAFAQGLDQGVGQHGTRRGSGFDGKNVAW